MQVIFFFFETKIRGVFLFYKFFCYSVILRALELPDEPPGRLDLYSAVYILKQRTCFYSEFLWLFLEDKVMDMNFGWCLQKKKKEEHPRFY